jgi:hypothetical protein
MRALLAFALLAGAPLSLGACAIAEELHREVFDTRKVNLTDQSYAAVDVLAQQTRPHMNAQTPLRVAVLTDVTTPTETTAFGQHIAQQVASRFVQLGYNVRAVPQGPGMVPGLAGQSTNQTMNPMAAPAPTQIGMSAGAPGQDVLVAGTYTRMKDYILVSLRMMQGAENRIIAAYDFSVPMTREMNEMSISRAEKEARKTINPMASMTTNY